MQLVCTIIMCEFHFYMQGLHRTFKGMLTVQLCHSIILEVYLTVWLFLVPTYITRIRGNRTVLEGDNIKLTCKATGRPEPNITWTKEKLGNQGYTVVVQEGKVLTITNINRIDTGEYTCTAYNGFGKPENQTVYVTVTCEYALRKTLNNV